LKTKARKKSIKTEDGTMSHLSEMPIWIRLLYVVALIAGISYSIRFVVWFGSKGMTWTTDDKTKKSLGTGAKLWRICVLIVVAALLIWGVFWFVNWLASLVFTAPVVATDTTSQTQEHGFQWRSWPWIRMALTAIIVAVFIGPFQKAWKASFFRDQRLPSDKTLAIWVGSYWPAVISVIGCVLCALAMIWIYSWHFYVALIVLVALFFSWKLGSMSMPENTQRWIPVFMGSHFMLPGKAGSKLLPDKKDSEVIKTHGLWFFLGSSDTPTPKVSRWMRLSVPPWWFWFMRVDVQSYLSFDEDFDVVGQTSEHQIVHLVGRLIFDRTCQHPSSFGTLPDPEQQASVTGSCELAVNRTVDFLAMYTQEQLRAGIDELLRKEHPELGANIADDVLRAKGHCVSLGNFGIPLASPEVVKAQNATVVAQAEAEQIRLKGTAEADVTKAKGEAQAAVDAARELAPAEALAAATPKVRESYVLMTDRKRAETVVVNGGAMPTFPINPQPRP